jgi:hypothetical protein
MRQFRVALALAALLGSSGCTSLAVETLDSKFSQITEADCSYAHVLVGEAYCRSHTLDRSKEPVYCFKSLGNVDCYAEADPYKINPSGRALQPQPLETPTPKPGEPPAAKDGVSAAVQ